MINFLFFPYCTCFATMLGCLSTFTRLLKTIRNHDFYYCRKCKLLIHSDCLIVLQNNLSLKLLILHCRKLWHNGSFVTFGRWCTACHAAVEQRDVDCRWWQYCLWLTENLKMLGIFSVKFSLHMMVQQRSVGML